MYRFRVTVSAPCPAPSSFFVLRFFLLLGARLFLLLALLLGLLLVIFGPIAAAIIQMAISRSREFVADADAASIAGTPAGLISALQKLDAASQRIPLHDGRLETQNHMFIVQPFSGKSLGKLFSTHPPTAQRVAKLRDLG